MAVRGINPFEKNVEKIFLALAAAGLTGVVAWQVAGGFGTVKVNGTDVPADQAYPSLAAKANTIQSQLREANPPLNEKLKSLVDPREAFKKGLSSPVAPEKQLAYQPAGPKFSIGNIDGPTNGNYAAPNFPASIKPIAHAFMSTVSETEIASIPELAKYMPAKAPLDKAAVSVQTTVDPKAIRAALEQDPDGAGPLQALLRAWWDKTEIVAVELVRQELKADGSWAGETATPALPGRTDLAPQLANPAMNNAVLTQIVNDAANAFDDIVRPQWYKRAELAGFVAGDAWQEPMAAATQTGPNVALANLQRQLREVNDEISRTQKAIDNLNNPANQPKPPAGGGGGSSGGKRPGGAGGGGGGGGGTTPQPKVDPRDEQKKALERRLEDAKRRKADIEKQIAAAGGNVAGASDVKTPTRDNDLSLLLSAPGPISVWHHDIDAKRGATYRYQIRIKVSNPLYNRATQLKENQDVAKSPTLSIPCADWSDPVHVDDEVYCFITGANAGANNPGGTGLGTAQANLMYFTWGYWRSDVVTLEPGDGMVARWKVPDETKIAANPAAPAPANPAPAPSTPGGGRRPGAAAAPGGGVAPPPTNPTPSNPAAHAGAALPTKEITKERDAFLLDVVMNPVSFIPSGAKTPQFSFLALIRDVDKSIVARNPSEDKNSPLFARLQESVAKGNDQLAGKGDAAQPGGAPNTPVPPSMPPVAPGQVSPGGGGGHGGG